MTLFELGQQYLEQEQKLRKRIKQLKADFDPNSNTDRRRLYYLTVEAADCKCIGTYLTTYYNKEVNSNVGQAFRI